MENAKKWAWIDLQLNLESRGQFFADGKRVKRNEMAVDKVIVNITIETARQREVQGYRKMVLSDKLEGEGNWRNTKFDPC